MKHSIRHKYMLILIGVVAAVIVVSVVALNLCLEPYYMNSKQKTLIQVRENLENRLVDDGAVTEETLLYLRQMKEINNIEIYLWDPSQGIIYGNKDTIGNGNDFMTYILGREKTVRQVKSTDQYEINETYDGNLEASYLEMFSAYSGGKFSIMRVPLQSVAETVSLVTRFYLYIAVGIAAIGIIAAWFLTKNMTAPILRLSDIAGRMSDLDFTAKYEGKDKNEIGILGQSMNNMSANLEKTISELKTANLELKRDIEQKTKIDEMRREFLSNVSHELKTPIALVQGYAEGLKEGISDDPESMEWYCDVIIDEAGKMNRMVRKLLTLNQIEAGREQVNMEHFDLVAMIKGVLNSYQILIQQKEAKVELHSPESLYIWADEYMAEEVIRNYVGNALNHVEGEKKIMICVEEKDGKAHVEVSNTGKNIPEADIGRIWEKFYKVDKARTREYGGSGIGLSIVRAAMEAMNGSYGVKNEEDGVSFFCEFDCR